MATQQYYDWRKVGKPYVLARPAQNFKDNIKRHSITVYDYPNDAHLTANKPEDHTPFSFTKWPNANTRVDGIGRAIDIMPRSDSYADRKENADIARQIIHDKDAGVRGTEAIKYLNWTDEHGVCRQENWKTGSRNTYSSSDSGHIHISFRNDLDNLTTAQDYDPLARMSGIEEVEENDMQKQMLVRFSDATNPQQIWLCNGMTRRAVSHDDVYGDTGSTVDGPLSNNQVHQESLLGNLGNGGAVFVSSGDPNVWGVDIASLGGKVNVDSSALAHDIAVALAKDPNNVLTDADIPAIVSAVTAKFAEKLGG